MIYWLEIILAAFYLITIVSFGLGFLLMLFEVGFNHLGNEVIDKVIDEFMGMATRGLFFSIILTFIYLAILRPIILSGT